MNSRPITSYEDLCKEKERLTELLKAQKAQIQRDVTEVKAEVKNELRPFLSLSENVSKLLHREDGKDPLVAAGTNIGIDILASKLFAKSNFILRLVLPSILKNLSSHLLPNVTTPSRRQLNSKPVTNNRSLAEKPIVREHTPSQQPVR